MLVLKLYLKLKLCFLDNLKFNIFFVGGAYKMEVGLRKVLEENASKFMCEIYQQEPSVRFKKGKQCFVIFGGLLSTRFI